MKHTIAAFPLFVVAGLAAFAAAPDPATLPSAAVPAVPAEAAAPVIDGDLSDAVWASAVRID